LKCEHYRKKGHEKEKYFAKDGRKKGEASDWWKIIFANKCVRVAKSGLY